MLCSHCNKNEANFHHTQIINGQYSQLHLCSECASKLGYLNIGINQGFGFQDILNEFFGISSQKPSINQKICPQCNTGIDAFLKSGIAGCEKCYDEFSDAVEKILSNIQPSSTHKGTISGEKGEKICSKNKLDSLKEDLKRAVIEERYEDAAKIRDMIKQEESKDTEGEDK